MKDILHCDLNGFFASVECVKNPSLKKVPMAVCGDPKTRHGVILAKNELAKKYNVVTAETIYSAKKKCPNLVLVQSNYADYKKYSKLVNEIYLKYTERVEPFSIDESFLDVTESKKLFGTPYEIAYKIKEDVKKTLGLTISVGVSFNKILAKMGSDMKKPDAITLLTPSNYKKILYPLPVDQLLFVGKSTCRVLEHMRIKTIGDLANYDVNKLYKKLGKLGIMIHQYANGIDTDEVELYGTKHDPKSISKGITLPKDVSDKNELIVIIREISSEIAQSLREKNMKCSVVTVTLKDHLFATINRQKQIFKTNLYQEISNTAIHILEENYVEGKKIRAITIAVSALESPNDEIQLDLFQLHETVKQNQTKEKLQIATKALDELKLKYGTNRITFGSLLKNQEEDCFVEDKSKLKY